MSNSINSPSSNRLYQLLESSDSEAALQLESKEGNITYQEAGGFRNAGSQFKAFFRRQSPEVRNILQKNEVVLQLKEDFKNLFSESLSEDTRAIHIFDALFETAFKGEKVTINMVKSFSEKIVRSFFKNAFEAEEDDFSLNERTPTAQQEFEGTFRQAEVFSEEDFSGLSGNLYQPWQEKFYNSISEDQKNKSKSPPAATAEPSDFLMVTATRMDSDTSLKGVVPEAVQVDEVQLATPSLTSEELTAIARLSGKADAYFKASLFAKPGKILELKNYYSKELPKDSPEKKLINDLRKWKDEKGDRPKSLTQGPQLGESASDWLQRCVVQAKQSQRMS